MDKNDVDVQDLFKKLADPSTAPGYSTVNLNSHTDISDPSKTHDGDPHTAITLAKILCNNTYVTDLQLSNCNVNTEGAKELASALTANKTLTKLNLETNKIGGEGVTAIFEALQKNQSLAELKLANQFQPIPTVVERSLGPLLEKNDSVIKLTIDIREQSSRNALDKVIFRNKDNVRKKKSTH